MIFALFYLLIGYISYPFMAKADGIVLEQEAWVEIAVAATVWAIIWLPLLLFKISAGGRR